MKSEERYATETVSHSGLNAFMVSPRSYRRYKDMRDSQETSASLNLGSAVHCYILEPDEFYGRYIEEPKEVPTPMYRKFVQYLVANKVGPASTMTKTDLYKSAYGHAGFKNPGIARVIERYETEDVFRTYEEFLEDLYSTGDLSPISSKDMVTIKTCKESTTTHKLAAQLLYGFPFAEAYNELEVLWKYPGHKFQMRGFIDRLVVDKSNKKCYMIDLKTTSKSVHNFSVSYQMYGYHRQLYLYVLATKHYLKEQGLDPNEFQIVPYIVVVQTTGNFETAVYQPSIESLKVAKIEVEAALGNLAWHFDNDLWDFPKDYYEGDGSLIVELNVNE